MSTLSLRTKLLEVSTHTYTYTHSHTHTPTYAYIDSIALSLSLTVSSLDFGSRSRMHSSRSESEAHPSSRWRGDSLGNRPMLPIPKPSEPPQRSPHGSVSTPTDAFSAPPLPSRRRWVNGEIHSESIPPY